MKKRLVKMMAGVVLSTMLMSYDVASAASISATLSSDLKKVTTTVGAGGSGYYTVGVSGYEYNELTGKYIRYSKENNYSGGGGFTTTHLADLNCTFQKNYGNGLMSSVFLGNSLIGAVVL